LGLPLLGLPNTDCSNFLLEAKAITSYICQQPVCFLVSAKMANASSKKSQKAEASTATKYLPYLIIASIVFFLSRFIFSEFLFSNVAILLVYSATYAVAYFGLLQASKNNYTAELYFDAFCVNMFSQLLFSFFSWGWYLWYLIPAYGVYQAVTYYLQMKQAPSASTAARGTAGGLAEEDEDDQKATKKREKKSRPKMQKMH
jgi:hypothetical protein